MPLAQPIAVADETAFAGTVDRPHPDIELHVERAPLNYNVCLPAAGLDRETGLVIFLHGYGMDPSSDYARNLLAHLANTYNCVAATLDYFGSRLMTLNLTALIPHPDFFKKLQEHHGVSLTAPAGVAIGQILAGTAVLLAQNGITQLHEECLVFNNSAEYNSMGFLPALDGLEVVHHLLKTLPINKARIFVLGTSYGGYIADLMAKLAPQTFRMIIDNSGFSSTEDFKAAAVGCQKLFLGGVSMRMINSRHWSLDPRASNFFSAPRQAIRDLHRREHLANNSARIYAYHAANDPVASTARKIALRDIYRDRIAYELTVVDDNQVDGRIFKNLTHGMNTSMRGIFDLSYAKFLRDGGALSDTTDFDLGTEHVFACGEEDYVIAFSRESGVSAKLHAV
jgi:pimeloyl-ACP methyl ester carboxylesterase